MVILAEEESTELLNATFRMLRWAWNGILILPLTTQASVKADLFIKKKKRKKEILSVFHMASIVKVMKRNKGRFRFCPHRGYSLTGEVVIHCTLISLNTFTAQL